MTQLIADVPFASVDGRPLLLDILRPDPPSAQPLPAIVELHPGAWLYGGKLAERNRIFAENGFFTVSADYRHSNEALFPAQLDDARAAVRWLRENAGSYGVDPERIGVWGESSGGHLAALLATAGDRDSPADTAPEPASVRVAAAATVSGVTDLVRLDNRFTTLLLGGPAPDQTTLAERANPTAYLGAGRAVPPMLVIHGEQDPQVPAEHAAILSRALEQVHADVTTVTFDAGHNLLSGPYGEQARRVLLDFFQRHLAS